MTGEATNPLSEFVSRYLGDRRGRPTSILHLGPETQAAVVRSGLADAAWDIETVDVTDDPGNALGRLKPRSADVIVATTPILETDFPWVTALRVANVLRPRGYACFSLDAGQTAGLSDSWFATLDGVVELTEWANLEALDLVSNGGGRLLVTRRPSSSGLRGVINQLKLDVLRSVSLQESRRRVDHLRIRRDQRRRDARAYVSLNPSQDQLSRSQYKETWQRVSADLDSAKISVAGYVDEESFATAARQTLEILEQTTGLHADDVVLEIGAGVGRMGPTIAPRVKQWIATDVSGNMLRHARQRCAGLENVDFIEISGWDLAPIPDESVDVVYCTVVFMHLDEWDRYAYIVEAMRILRPGGRLFVDGINLCGEPGWELFLDHYTSYAPLERPPNISKTSTPQELEEYFRRAGVEDYRVGQKPDDMWVYAYGRKPT